MRNPLLSIALWLFHHILPSDIKDDISGDLEEEYTEHVLPDKGQFKASIWLLKQTSLTCAYHVFNYSNGLIFSVTLISISVFFILTVGVSILGNVNVPELNNAFWQEWGDGSYKLFFHPAFWQYMPEFYLHYSEYGGITIWLEADPILYSICALYLIFKINKNFHLNIKTYVFFTMTLMFIPYFLGSYLLLGDLVPTQIGPIVAIMWLTTVYMILPVGYQLIKKIIDNKGANSTLLS